MGIIYMPSPSDDVLTLILVNTALTVSLLKQIISSVLSYFGWTRPSEPEDSVLTLTDLFRVRFTPVQFGSGTCRSRTERHVDCRVCLNRFRPESVVNRLPCGHVFHKGCLETWLDYQHATCPLCRSQLLSGGGERHPGIWF